MWIPSPNDYNDAEFSNELKSIRELVNWEVESERSSFFDRVRFLCRHWQGQLPDFHEIFRPEEIDWLIIEDVKNKHNPTRGQCSIVQFLNRAGYKDKPEIDENGQPLVSRTTALHWVCRNVFHSLDAVTLFEIYNRSDVNYTDESGLSHFHAACKFGLANIVEKFVKLGQDPNCLWRETGDMPLHLALVDNLLMYKSKVVELLLRNGADPKLPNGKGLTPLHLICTRDADDDLVNMFFKIIDEKHQTLHINVLDKLGRTPLQWAVASHLPETVDVLLDRGADLSSFVFPTESYFGKVFDREHEFGNLHTMRQASKAMLIVERLEKRGYELNRSDAMTIMKSFAKNGLFEKMADPDTSWYDDEDFESEAEEWIFNSSLSLYDLVRLQPKEAEKLFTYTNYREVMDTDYSEDYWYLPEEIRDACTAQLTEIVIRKFCRRWVLDSFLELTRNRLPILCCEIIISKLSNEDSWRICLAATIQSS